jgi:hypothetical protein
MTYDTLNQFLRNQAITAAREEFIRTGIETKRPCDCGAPRGVSATAARTGRLRLKS